MKEYLTNEARKDAIKGITGCIEAINTCPGLPDKIGTLTVDYTVNYLKRYRQVVSSELAEENNPAVSNKVTNGDVIKMVAIKDFEMPKICEDCRLFSDRNSHCALGCFIPYDYDYYTETYKNEKCPLLEIKENEFERNESKLMNLFKRTLSNCELYENENRTTSLLNEIGVLRGIAYCLEAQNIDVLELSSFQHYIEIQNQELNKITTL